ncbi:hypothetical protein A3216_09440 [Mycobacterium leprae 7935681]|nr:hypothetical protein A3216_09440 [Mycobacterium leprae 7935681]
MAALNRACLISDCSHGAVGVGENLHFNMMSVGQLAYAEHRRIAEGGLRFVPGCGDFCWHG